MGDAAPKRRSRVPDEAVRRVLSGESATTVAREYGLPRSTLLGAVEAAKRTGATASATAVDSPEVRITGGLRTPDDGEFCWQNVDGIPTEEQIRDVLRRVGQNPDEWEWWVVELDFAENDTAWKRDAGVARDMAGVDGTAYTGTAKRGRVKLKFRRREAAKLRAALEGLPRIDPTLPRYRCVTCSKRFDSSPVGTLWCSAKCQRADAKRPARDHGVVRHVFIPDTQVKPGVPTDHLMWAGQWIREHCAGRRTRIIHLGDHWDMHSLSSYDRGKLAAEGARVTADFEAGNRALEVLEEAAGDDPMWDWYILQGNHEERIDRYVSEHPELEGFLSYDNCATSERWVRVPFLEVLWLDGIAYSHYFYQPNTGRPYGGENIEARIRQVGHSFVMGHQQGLRIGMHYAAGKQRLGIVAGSFYQHDEGYKGPQGNAHWRGIGVLNNVVDGSADPMPLSIDYLCRRYAGHRIDEHEGVVL